MELIGAAILVVLVAVVWKRDRKIVEEENIGPKTDAAVSAAAIVLFIGLFVVFVTAVLPALALVASVVLQR